MDVSSTSEILSALVVTTGSGIDMRGNARISADLTTKSLMGSNRNSSSMPGAIDVGSWDVVDVVGVSLRFTTTVCDATDSSSRSAG